MESVLGRVVVMVVVGVIGGAVAILLVRAESEQREAAAAAGRGGGGDVDKQKTSNINETLRRGNAITGERSIVPEVAARDSSDVTQWRQQLSLKNSQSDQRISTTSQMANDAEADGGFLDELILAIKRRLSYVEEGKEELRRGKRQTRNENREKRYVGEEEGGVEGWQETITNGGKETEAKDAEGANRKDDSDTWRRKNSSSASPVDHRIRHSRRKAHHRHHKAMTTPSDITTYDHNTRSRRPGIVERPPEELPNGIFDPSSVRSNGTVAGHKPSNKTQIIDPNRINSQFDNLTNVIIMGNITHIRTPHDIIEDDGTMATEIREALLLAIPLSLLLTVILLICVAFCCCRYRSHLAYSDHMSYALREDHDYGEEWPPTVGMGMCDVCLPDISYQAHLATKFKNAKKRRAADDQMELVLDGETMECQARDEGLKCHPPLYALLSNLPPGSSSHLDDDGRVSPFSSFGSSRPKRSQSLEFLTV